MQNLLKVLIIDDERMIRNLLKTCVDWNGIGCTIAGESANAEEGLKLIDRIIPDILFTDICMPVMDGLELSRRVKDKHPQIKIVILTGYEEFEYAKKGIEAEVSNFLLKPINNEEIIKTVLKIKEKILQEKIHTEEYDGLKEQLSNNMLLLKEKVLNDIIKNNVDWNLIETRLAYYDFRLNENYYQAAVAEVWSESVDGQEDEEEKLYFNMRCMEIIQHFFSETKCIYTFFDDSQRIVLLSNQPKLNLFECFVEIKSKLIEELNCYVCIGIGNIYEKKHMIHVSYKEACASLKYMVIAGKNQIIPFSNFCLTQTDNTYVIEEYLKKYCFYLKACLTDKVEETILTLFSELKTSVHSREIKVLVCSFISSILNILIETGIDQKNIFSKTANPFECVFRLDTLPEAQNFILEISMRVIGCIIKLQSKKELKTIREVKAFINLNYTRPDLTLSEVAKRFFLNLSYLSRIFKEKTGITFQDYLSMLRMSNAIRLLRDTDKKAYEIAEEVGISNPNYFSYCFKKYTGMNFHDYKKSI